MPPTPRRKSSTASPSNNISQSLYEKECTKADDFVTFMTSPSPSKRTRSMSSQSVSPSIRFANRPPKSYSSRSPKSNQHGATRNNDKKEVVPFLALETSPKGMSQWSESEASPLTPSVPNMNATIDTTNKSTDAMERRGISPNTHGRAIAHSLSSPYLPTGTTPIKTPNKATLYSTEKSKTRPSQAEAALLNAHKRGRSYSPRGKVPNASIKTGGNANKIIADRVPKKRGRYSPLRQQLKHENLQDNVTGGENVAKTATKSQKSNNGHGDVQQSSRRKSNPPKSYYDLYDKDDRESPSRLDNPSYGLLPLEGSTKKEKSDERSAEKSTAITDNEDLVHLDKLAAVNGQFEPANVKIMGSPSKSNIDSTDGKKRRRSRARRHVGSGFSLGDLDAPTPKLESSNVQVLPSEATKKQIVSNKELEEMMSKKRRQSAERKKKAVAKKEAMKLTAEEPPDVVKQNNDNKATRESEKEKVPTPQRQDNLIVRLLTDSPSGDDSKALSSSQSLLNEQINQYTSRGNISATIEKQDAKNKAKNAENKAKVKPLSKDAAVPQKKIAGSKVLCIERASPSLKTSSKTLMSKGSSKTFEGNEESAKKVLPSFAVKESKASKSISSKKKLPESLSRAERQTTSSLEKVQQISSPKISSDSPGHRVKRQNMSSLEMAPSPQSPLRAKRLLSALHDDIISLDALKSSISPREKNVASVGTSVDGRAPSAERDVDVTAAPKEHKNESLSPLPIAQKDSSFHGSKQVQQLSINQNNVLDTPNRLDWKYADASSNADFDKNKLPDRENDISAANGSFFTARRAFDASDSSHVGNTSHETAMTNGALRQQLDQSAPDSQALVLHNAPVNLGKTDHNGIPYFHLQLQENEFLNKRAEFNRSASAVMMNTEHMLALQNKMAEIDSRVAALHRVGEFHSPVHQYESVSRTYHSEIISSKRRRFHHFDGADDYADNRHYSSRQSHHGILRDKRRSSGSKRHMQQGRYKKSIRRYEDDETDDSDLEFLQPSSGTGSRKRLRKANFRHKRNDSTSENSESDSEHSPEISRKNSRRKKEKRQSKHVNDYSDGSDVDLKQVRHGSNVRSRRKAKHRSRQAVNYSDDSETESDHSRGYSPKKSTRVDKRKTENSRFENNIASKKSPGSQKQRSRQESPNRRARVGQTSVLESVSPARKERSRLESPKRAKSSQSSVLENFGNDSDSQYTKSPTKDLNISVNEETKNIETKNTKTKEDDADKIQDANKPIGQSYWLTGDGSESDWDFEGPMILPPPPI